MADDNSLENYSPAELADMGKLYATMVKDPTTREAALRLTKKVSPGTTIPEIDVLDRVAHGVKPYVDKINQLEQKFLAKDVETKIETKRKELRKLGHNDDQIDAIEKLMVEKQIPDHATAAEFYKLQNQQTKPTPSNWNGNNALPIDKEKAKLAGGFKKFFMQDAHAAVDDIRNGKIRLQ
jgi:hypothetical protein